MSEGTPNSPRDFDCFGLLTHIALNWLLFQVYQADIADPCSPTTQVSTTWISWHLRSVFYWFRTVDAWGREPPILPGISTVLVYSCHFVCIFTIDLIPAPFEQPLCCPYVLCNALSLQAVKIEYTQVILLKRCPREIPLSAAALAHLSRRRNHPQSNSYCLFLSRRTTRCSSVKPCPVNILASKSFSRQPVFTTVNVPKKKLTSFFSTTFCLWMQTVRQLLFTLMRRLLSKMITNSSHG